MTDETIVQINRDANKWWKDNDGPEEDPDGLFEDAYTEGATHQHPISFKQGRKDGWNQAIFACLHELSVYKSDFEYEEDYHELTNRMHQLKKP